MTAGREIHSDFSGQNQRSFSFPRCSSGGAAIALTGGRGEVRQDSTSLVLGNDVRAGEVLVMLDSSGDALRLREEESRLISFAPRITSLNNEIAALGQARGGISNPPSLRASTQPLTTGGCLARKIGSAKDRRNAGRLGGRGASAGLRNWPLRRRLAASQPPVIIILAIQIVSVKSIGSRPANAGKMPELRFKVARTLVMIAHS